MRGADHPGEKRGGGSGGGCGGDGDHITPKKCRRGYKRSMRHQGEGARVAEREEGEIGEDMKECIREKKGGAWGGCRD